MAVDFKTQLAADITSVGKRLDAILAGTRAPAEPGPAAAGAAPAPDGRLGVEPGRAAAIAPAEPGKNDVADRLAMVAEELKKALEMLTRLVQQLGKGDPAPQPDKPAENKPEANKPAENPALPPDPNGQPVAAGGRAQAGQAAGAGAEAGQAGAANQAAGQAAAAAAAGGADANQKQLGELIEALAKVIPVLTKLLMQLISIAQTGKDLSVETHPRDIKGSEPGGWLVKHGQYKKNADGSYDITGGKYSGHKAVPKGGGKYEIYNPQGYSVGKFSAPGGAEKIASPLTFDLDGDGKVGTTGVDGGRQFDIDGDGKVDQTAWASKGDGVLAFDADRNGVAGENGRELLGNNTDIDGDGKVDGHANGFEALKALAAKHLGAEAVADGKLDAVELAALESRAGLTMLVGGERKSLSALGISEVKLGYTEAGSNADANGNEHRQVGAGFVRNGQAGKVNDVWFRYQ